MADGNIIKDILYDAVAPVDFESMFELDRYAYLQEVTFKDCSAKPVSLAAE